MGRNAPWLDKVQTIAKTMTNPTDVVVDVTDMAALMVQADLAIGAAGGTSWERCALGLPSLMLVLADNQKAAAQAMDTANVAALLGDIRTTGWKERLWAILDTVNSTHTLSAVSKDITDVIDGLGCVRCCTEIERILAK